MQAGQDDRPVAHFLHVGKTGGTALKVALREAAATTCFAVQLHRHAMRLADLPPEDPFFFGVRDPVARFVSGFLSRQRKGWPAHNSPWRPEEEVAFGRFSTPEELALALTSPDPARTAQAREAMGAIEHVNQSFWYWFENPERLAGAADRILWIGRQEQLDEDLPLLAGALGLDEIVLPSASELAHRAPEGAARDLSAEAGLNIRRWYSADYDFLALCEELRLNRPAARLL